MAAPSGTNFGSKRGTSNIMILVPLFDLKFLNELAECGAGTSNRRHLSGRPPEPSADRVPAPASELDLLHLPGALGRGAEQEAHIGAGRDVAPAHPDVFGNQIRPRRKPAHA